MYSKCEPRVRGVMVPWSGADGSDDMYIESRVHLPGYILMSKMMSLSKQVTCERWSRCRDERME